MHYLLCGYFSKCYWLNFVYTMRCRVIFIGSWRLGMCELRVWTIPRIFWSSELLFVQCWFLFFDWCVCVHCLRRGNVPNGDWLDGMHWMPRRNIFHCDRCFTCVNLRKLCRRKLFRCGGRNYLPEL